jgi:hypothetical protein
LARGLLLCPTVLPFYSPFPNLKKNLIYTYTFFLDSSMLECKSQGLLKTLVCSQHFRGSLSFFSLSLLLHCQGNGLSSVLRESSWEIPGLDPALSAQQAGLHAGGIAEVGGSVSLPNAHSPHMPWDSWKMGRPGCLKLQHAFLSFFLSHIPPSHPFLWG